jgi:acetyl esterase/lipase
MRRTILQVVAMAAVAVSMFAASASAMHVRANGGNATYILKKNVAYLPDRTRAEKADLYIPKPTGVKRNDTSRPAMVIVHGGGFTKNDKGDARERVVSKILASNGVVAMSINYLLSSNKTGNVFPTNI